MAAKDDLPPEIVDQAINWSVMLASGMEAAADRADYHAWLASDERHVLAMERLALIDQDLSCVSGPQASKVLESLGGRRSTVWPRGILSVLLLFCVWLGIKDPYHWRADYATAAGEMRRVDLPHGAWFHLDAESAVKVREHNGQPIIELLAGEVLVDSHKAALDDKPWVRTADGMVRPLGTRFEVGRFQEGTRVAVLVGQVELLAPSGEVLGRLDAGELGNLQQGELLQAHSDGLKPGAWVEGVIEADNARLGTVIEALDAHFAGWLRCAPEVADIRVTGVFQLADAAAALDALQDSLPVRVQRTTDWWVTVHPASGAAP